MGTSENRTCRISHLQPHGASPPWHPAQPVALQPLPGVERALAASTAPGSAASQPSKAPGSCGKRRLISRVITV